MEVQPREVRNRLRDHHLPRLSADDARLLAGLLCGLKAGALGPKLFRSERDIRRGIDRLTDLICTPLGAGRSLATVGRWTAVHGECQYQCAKDVHSLLESGGVFLSETASEMFRVVDL